MRLRFEAVGNLRAIRTRDLWVLRGRGVERSTGEGWKARGSEIWRGLRVSKVERSERSRKLNGPHGLLG